ncbi:hypothetical protein GGD55_004679 [Rhizobium giardinii]|uniref:Uncharacterized protein n=1 Tax=Rhizobium giardinii TaxID=56731 RepID=A0A7W8UEQ1_9HYPH|nr:hypothetical protein [Rhizobium giardinii]
MTVEGHLVGVGCFGDGIDADAADTVLPEKLASR